MSTCYAVRQQDEMFCAKCDLRWDVTEDAPCSPEARADQREVRTPTEDSEVLQYAKAIAGPHSDRFIGRETMLKLRDHTWKNMLTDAERKTYLGQARAVLREVEDRAGLRD